MPRSMAAGRVRRSIWASLSSAPARLIFRPSASPSQPSRSASAMRAVRNHRFHPGLTCAGRASERQRQPRERPGSPPAGSGPLPAMIILIYKTKAPDSTVTRPGGWQPGRPAHNPRVESWPPLDRAGTTAGSLGRCRRRGPSMSRHGRGFGYDPGAAYYRVIRTRVPRGMPDSWCNAAGGTRTQPLLTAWPNTDGSGQPCRPTVPGPPPKVDSALE
jgi:hypothetical protein